MAEKKKQQQEPLLIIITRTRNYGWVTRAFLEGNTRWADYIIITDQMSTDSTRPSCAEYNALHNDGTHKAEVVIVDDHDMEFKENSGFKMAFAKGRELANGRDAIYFALDIDEVMPANWMETDDGKRILNSNPGDMFSIAWANIQPDNETYIDERMVWDGKYTVFNDNGMEWQENNIEFHAPHLPYSTWDKDPYAVKDFALLHFGWYNTIWNDYKGIYHQMLDIHQHRSSGPIAFFRTYVYPRKTIWHKESTEEGARHNKLKPIEKEWLFDDFDLFAMIDMSSEPIFVEYIRELLEEDGINKYFCIDIWNEDMQRIAGVKNDPRPIKWRMIHTYAWLTQPYKKSLVVRGIDKVLKKVLHV